MGVQHELFRHDTCLHTRPFDSCHDFEAAVPFVQQLHDSNASALGSAWAYLPRARHYVAGDTRRADAGRLWFRTVLQTLQSRNFLRKLYKVMPVHRMFQPAPQTQVNHGESPDCCK